MHHLIQYRNLLTLLYQEIPVSFAKVPIERLLFLPFQEMPLTLITYKAYPGETVTISGADPLTGGWTQHQGAIYKTTMNWDLGLGNNQIFVDRKAMMEARWPDANDVMKTNLLDIDRIVHKVDYECFPM